MRPILLLAALVMTMNTQPPAPRVLAPGDTALGVAKLQPYKVRWKETIVNIVNQVIERGTWDDELSRTTLNGREVLVRAIVVTQPDGSTRETYRVVIDARTLAPIRSEWTGRGLSYDYQYAGRAITGRRLNAVGAAPVLIQGQAPRLAFDYYGGMMELFLAVLPRTPGSKLTFPALLSTSGSDADQTGIDWPLVEVFPEELVRGAGDATVKAVRMEATTKHGFYKVWVTDTAPYVVRTVLVLAPGGRITYELL